MNIIDQAIRYAKKEDEEQTFELMVYTTTGVAYKGTIGTTPVYSGVLELERQDGSIFLKMDQIVAVEVLLQ
jgi:K+ transporter